MNRFYFRTVYDNSKQNEIKLDIRRVGLLTTFNKNQSVFCAYYIAFWGKYFDLKNSNIIFLYSKGNTYGKCEQQC